MKTFLYRLAKRIFRHLAPAKPSPTAPGSRFEAIKLHLCGGTWQRINDISGELGIPRSTVSTVLHRHTGTFVRDPETGCWGLRKK